MIIWKSENYFARVIWIEKHPAAERMTLMQNVVEASWWMFRSSDPQIMAFNEEAPGAYRPRSLEALPKDVFSLSDNDRYGCCFTQNTSSDRSFHTISEYPVHELV